MDTTLKVNRERINARLSAMGKVGALPGGGVCRLALSDEDRQGRDLIARWMHEMDLEVTIDWIGNIIGIRAGLEDGPVVMTGSHLDTVATGGLFDGSFGVLAGLEVIQTLNERGIDTRKPIALAVFTNEEGVRFMPDMMGSLVFCGKVSIEEARAIIATDGSSVGDNLDRIGYSGRALPGSIPVQCFVELHVEQGPVLAAKGITIGAVEVVQGISWFEFVIGGVTNHAGTTPMESRHDAGYGAASIACFVRELCTKIGHEHRATVGSLSLSPNLVNVIPGEAKVTVDMRNRDEALLEAADDALLQFAEEISEREGVKISTKRLARVKPESFEERMVALIERKACDLGYSVTRIASGAGHDAQILAPVIPTAMIFIPSREGISHSVVEYSSPQDVAAGANVLLHVLLELAG